MTNPNDPGFILQGDIRVGCNTCQSGSCSVPGTGWIKISSIDARFGLGKAKNGTNAGDLLLAASAPGPTNSTPQALQLSTTGYATSLTDANGIRQVVAPEAFVDVQVVDPYGYRLNFYSRDAMGPLTNGFHAVAAGATPYVTWQIENPDRSPTVYNRLRITETRGASSNVSEYVWDEALRTWSLSKGNGAEILSKSETVSGSMRVTRETSRDAAGFVASDVQETYRQVTGGGSTREELVERVVDPEGDALTTTTAYYEDPCPAGSCGRIRSQVNPDGSWVRYEYDADGRLTAEVRSYLDASSSASASQARATGYDYTPLAGDTQDPENVRLPRTVTETVLGVVTGRTWHVYQTDAQGRWETVERAATASAAYADPANERTVTGYYPLGSGGPEEGRLRSVLHPDGRLDTTTYAAGSYASGTFTPGTGAHVRETVTHGTAAFPGGVAGKSTREKTVKDAVGNVLLQETWVVTGTGEERLDWTLYTLDELGRPETVEKSDGTRTDTVWTCCGKESETDARGVTTTYVPDALKRVASETRPGPQGAIVTTYEYDAQGRVLAKTSVSQGLLEATGQTFDLAGRLRTATDAAGLTTTYDYAAAGLVTTVTRPGGATEVTERYLDGRVKSVTGTAVPDRFTTYGVHPDGTQWTLVRFGSETSEQWEQTTTDLLERTIRVEKPGSQGVEAAESVYDAGGRLWATTAPGQAATLYQYDELGNPWRTGLDVDGDNQLTPASLDRIQETQTGFVALDGAWWEETVQQVYAADDDATPTVAGIQRTRRTGLGNGLVAEAVAVDASGNETATTVALDRANRTEWKTTSFPDSSTPAVETSVGGLLASSQTKTGVTTTFGYDALGRRTAVTDPRTGTSVTHRNALGQVDWVEDAAGHRTAYTYEPATGRLATETNPENHVTRYGYDLQGHLTHTWGDAAYPVRTVYDEQGRKIELHTWRAGTEAAWNTPEWPASEPVSPDVTRWHYDPATGLLAAKEDAAGKQVAYTYAPGGRLATRSWARLDGANPLVTAYGYDPATAELTTIDYSDATPDVAFTYDRLGRQQTVTDAAGTRTFTYRPDLQPDAETLNGLVTKTLTRTYEDGTLQGSVPGRPSGFTLGAGYEVTWGREPATGRLSTVWWGVNGTSDSAGYAYLPGSDLLGTRTLDGSVVTTYGYEPNRNLQTLVKNQVGATLVSQVAYEYNPLGQRSAATWSGKAVNAALTQKLTGQAWFANAPNTGSGIELLPDYRGYAYDPIGNRTQTTTRDPLTQVLLPITYTPNGLNQYDHVAPPAGGTEDLAYDEDGNLQAHTTPAKATWYTYDAENRLTQVEPQNPTTGTKKVTFTYDYMGRRVQKRVYTYSGGWSLTSDTRFVYDGWNVVQELNASGQVLKSYVWGLDLSNTLQGAGGIGGLLASVGGTSTYYFLYDGNGNVGQLVNAADGSIAAHYEYDPFGNAAFSNGALAGSNPFRFSTKYYDGETGLAYYGYRYYAAGLGRWVNRDPLGENGGINLYGFVWNDPLNKVDYLGLWSGVQHRLLTGNAWGRLTLPQGMGQYSAQIEADLMTNNENTDSAPTATNNAWHFNRGLKESVASGIAAYKNLLSSEDQHFATLIASPSETNCKEAIRVLGMLSHAWQDYYAHAIDVKSDGSKGTIGYVTGSPSQVGSSIKPASFGWYLPWQLGEHGASEPGQRALDTADRVARSANYTHSRFKPLVASWWGSCNCYAGRIYP